MYWPKQTTKKPLSRVRYTSDVYAKCSQPRVQSTFVKKKCRSISQKYDKILARKNHKIIIKRIF